MADTSFIFCLVIAGLHSTTALYSIIVYILTEINISMTPLDLDFYNLKSFELSYFVYFIKIRYLINLYIVNVKIVV